MPEIQRVDTVPFGCFRRSRWHELGGFDEELISNQDYDFNHRVRRAGYQVLLNPNMECVYRSRPTLDALARQYYRYGFWKRQMLRKSPGALRWRQVPPVLVLPWLAVTGILTAVSGHVFVISAAAAYPLVVLAGALGVAGKLRDATAVPLAAAAIATVHLSWSAGFWRALLGRRPDTQ
jgi:succinoglycan biosynthesis protein ExoA